MKVLFIPFICLSLSILQAQESPPGFYCWGVYDEGPIRETPEFRQLNSGFLQSLPKEKRAKAMIVDSLEDLEIGLMVYSPFDSTLEFRGLDQLSASPYIKTFKITSTIQLNDSSWAIEGKGDLPLEKITGKIRREGWEISYRINRYKKGKMWAFYESVDALKELEIRHAIRKLCRSFKTTPRGAHEKTQQEMENPKTEVTGSNKAYTRND